MENIKMTNALFTYRRRVVVNGVEVFNDNYINPLNVCSFYWSESAEANAEPSRTLNVFLNNNYTIPFRETVGKRFVEHMEDFLRFTLAGATNSGAAPSYSQQQNHSQNPGQGPRKQRRAVEAEIVDEDPTPAAVQWENN